MALFAEIVTPEGQFFSGAVEELLVPAYLGEMNILPGHVPFLVVMEAGALMVRANHERHYYAVDRGFVQIKGDHVSIMTEVIAPLEGIDVNEARKRRDDALAQLERIRQGEITARNPDEVDALESTIRFAMAQQVTQSRGK